MLTKQLVQNTKYNLTAPTLNRQGETKKCNQMTTENYDVVIQTKKVVHSHYIETKEDIEILKLVFAKIIHDAEKHIEKTETHD